MTRLFVTALLYASLGLGANPLAAQGLDPALRAELQTLRDDDMRKLVFLDAPRPAGAVEYLGSDGVTHTLADSNGKIRVVNFWATWCAPCRQEKPALDALQGAMAGPDFEVIAIATGRNSDAAIKRFNAEVGIEHLATNTDPKSAAARSMGVLGLPVTLILDREGNEIARLQGGADWAGESTQTILSRLIAAGS